MKFADPCATHAAAAATRRTTGGADLRGGVELGTSGTVVLKLLLEGHDEGLCLRRHSHAWPPQQRLNVGADDCQRSLDLDRVEVERPRLLQLPADLGLLAGRGQAQ